MRIKKLSNITYFIHVIEIGIRFEGTRESVEEASATLKAVLNDHVNMKYKVNKIGIPRYMYHDNGRAKIAHLQAEHKASVC